jgi:hypothetical protein
MINKTDFLAKVAVSATVLVLLRVQKAFFVRNHFNAFLRANLHTSTAARTYYFSVYFNHSSYLNSMRLRGQNSRNDANCKD